MLTFLGKYVKFKNLADEWLRLVKTTKEMKQSTTTRIESLKERTYKALGKDYADKITYRQIQQFIIRYPYLTMWI